MSNEQIRGKVAAIINKRELALNVGEEAGVTTGMRFAILNTKGVGVKDPDTGELLGDLPVAKTVVKVVRVDGPRLSTARTFRTIAGTPGIADLLVRTQSWAGTPSRKETLALDPDDDRVELGEEESYVKVGDVAVQTVGDEYDDYS